MTDTEQAGLGSFESGGEAADDGDRPQAEAEAVAGLDTNGGVEEVDPMEERLPEATGTVELTVTQVDYTIVGSGSSEEPVLHVFGRTADRDLEHVKVLGFRPYFYAPTDTLDDGKLDRDTITGYEEGYESIRGEDLTRIYGRTPRDVGQMRDEFDHYEADILFPNRLLIDKDIRGGVRLPERRGSADGPITVHHSELEPAEVDADPRVCMLDIEVDDRHGFPEEGEEPILCLTTHDSYRDEYVAWLYVADEFDGDVPDSLPNYEQIGDESTIDVRAFDTEPAMLAAVLEYVDEETDPDMISGWNCLPGDSEIQMADGTVREIRDVEIGDTVVGSDDQRPTTAEVTNKWESEKAILEFDLEDGSSLRASEEHRVMVGDDDSVDWKEGGAIEPGDYVLKPRKLAVDDPEIPVLRDLVSTECQRFEDEDTVREFKNRLPNGAIADLADEFDVARGTLYHNQPGVWTPTRCEHAASEFDVALPDGGVQYRRGGISLDREITERELYFAGLVMTDGTLSVEDGVRFYNTCIELHEQFPGDGSLQPDGKGCYKQTVLDFARAYVFNGLGIPFGDKNATDIDLSTVYQMPEEYVAQFLAGAMDGDGSISSSIVLAAENRSLGEWYVKLFKRLGIYAEQRENIVRIPDAERDVQRLRKNVLPYMNHPEKAERLRSFEGGKSGRTENVPYAMFEAEVGSDERRIGRDKHRRGINLKRHETSRDDWEEYVFVGVDAVETVGTETTYDIETTTHNFVAEECLVHNCDDFDIPYVLDRLERVDAWPDHDYDLSIDQLSRVNEVWRSDWGGPDVKGRVVFDLLYAYKRTQFTELESYRLDAVGEMELDVGKERYPGDIGDLWEDDPERLLEYNVRDVELCVEIDEEQGVIPFWQQVASFVGCKIEDAPTPGDAVDMYVLHEAYGKFVLPSKGQQEAEEFEGGAVFDPITGVRENVTVLDLKSLYPMSMVTINASPETKVDPGEYDGDTYRTPTGVHFRKDPDGIIREMVDELLTEREEKKALRNENDPGSEDYERFDRQQGAVKVIMNCFTPDTEVLTPDGVRNIRDLDVGDDVYSLDPDSMEMEVKPVTETHEYPDYRGELVDVQTSKIDFRVTPNHRMLVRKNDENGITEDGWGFVEAGDLDTATNYELPHDWTTDHGEELESVDLTDFLDEEYEVWVRPEVHGHTFATEIGYYPDTVLKNDVGQEGYVFSPDEFEDNRDYIEEVAERTYVHAESGRKWIPRTFDGDDFLDLLGWYVTEGNVYTSETKEFGDQLRGSATTIQIAQEAATVPDGGEPHHATIGELLERMGFDYYKDDRSYQFTSKLLGNTLERLCGGESGNKRIPEFVFDLCERQKRRFLETLVDGDGDRGTNSWRFTTSSDQLRDDVLRLCTHLGLTASYNRDSGSWRIYVTENAKNTLRMHRSGGRSTADDGVYCVTVEENHSLLAGRNGKFQFVGQSLYGVFGWDRFRLYDREMSAGVTSTNREVIQYTENSVNEEGYDVVYGDTDSVMIELGSDVSKDEAIEKSFELEDRINESYDEFALEQLNAAAHRFQIEFEKLYRRFFQAGKKKRYAGHIVWKEGKDVDDIDITGFEYQRSDIAGVTKRVQKEVIDMIVTGADEDEIVAYVSDVIDEFLEGNADLDDIGIPGGIGKRLDAYDTPTAQVRGAKYANLLLGTNFDRGSKPKRLYLEKVHPDFFERIEEEKGLDAREDPLYGEFKRDPDVICFEYADQVPEEFQVDYDKMLDKTLKGPIERILEAIDVSWDEVKSGQEQTGLGKFM